ncbi:MAG TPA: DUF2127 domain-containing protein [Lysobacter sp.]|jgi:uncharacterized membrane protein (DUF2068 family)|nr:DUF2127 domain-containing protein [Lysobacter sp.]
MDRSDPSHPHYNPNPRAHPGLRAIALIEAIKGLLALSAASGLEIIGSAPLKRWVHALINEFQLDPQHGAMAWLAGAISPGSVHFAAAAVAAYAILHLIEAWGLWRDKAWASWLGCIAAAIYLPFDIYALVRHPGWVSVAVLAVNVLIVWVLARDLVKRRW